MRTTPNGGAPHRPLHRFEKEQAMSATLSPPIAARRRAGRLATAARVAWGVFFAASAAYNTVMPVPHARPVFEW